LNLSKEVIDLRALQRGNRQPTRVDPPTKRNSRGRKDFSQYEGGTHHERQGQEGNSLHHDL